MQSREFGLKAPLRVLHVLGALDRGGVERWLLGLLPRLDRSMWQFDFCVLGPGEGRDASRARQWGSRVLHCPADPRWKSPARLYRLFRSGGYDIVHSHVHHFSGVVLAAARAAGLRARLAHSHNTHDGCPSTWPRALYRASAAALLGRFATHAAACTPQSAAALFAARRAEIVPYGLDGSLTDLYLAEDSAALRGALGIAATDTILGHVGRFDRQKNHDFLLDVALAMQPLRPGARWLLVGDGAGRSRLARRAAALGLARTVVFAGLRDDVPRLMQLAMDAFVFPSLHEGQPLALLEAQAAGLRSVASARISRQSAVVRGAVEFLPLEAGPRVWAERALASADAGRLPLAHAREQLLAAGLSLSSSLERLLELYCRAAP